MNRKQLYWGLGIGSAVIALGIIIHHNRKKITMKAEEGINNVKAAAKSGVATIAEAIEQTKNWIKPVIAKVSSPFGYRINPVTKQKGEFHNGVDLPVKLNTEVKSPMDGTVVNVYNNAAGGNQVIIKHTNGYFTGYAHLNKALVTKGEAIKQGQVIALSGNTGKSTGPHVHFTMKDAAGNYLDPAKIMFA